MPKIVYDDWSEQEFNQEDFISREELSEKYISKEEVENNYVSKEYILFGVIFYEERNDILERNIISTNE